MNFRTSIYNLSLIFWRSYFWNFIQFFCFQNWRIKITLFVSFVNTRPKGFLAFKCDLGNLEKFVSNYFSYLLLYYILFFTIIFFTFFIFSSHFFIIFLHFIIFFSLFFFTFYFRLFFYVFEVSWSHGITNFWMNLAEIIMIFELERSWCFFSNKPKYKYRKNSRLEIQLGKKVTLVSKIGFIG